MFEDILEFLSGTLKFVTKFVWKHGLSKQIKDVTADLGQYTKNLLLEKDSRFTKKIKRRTFLVFF